MTSHQAGRIGLPILLELHKSGYQVTVLTQDATRLQGLPANVKIQHVDYDSDDSLIQALQDQDALIVATSTLSRRTWSLIIPGSGLKDLPMERLWKPSAKEPLVPRMALELTMSSLRI
jgi:uncharacterized protein YbjT (DUF2867 family)